MSNINKAVAEEIVKQLKKNELISIDEKNIENQIASGTIKENEWKLLFEQQIRNNEKLKESETK
jgi:hypothetical protein